MWIFTVVGFFSVTVDKDDKSRFNVRARVRKDLDLLRSSYLPELTPTIQLPGRDYPYRGYCTKEQWAAALVEMAMSLDYSNFKNEVAARQSWAVERLYAQVWGVMNDAERKIKENEADEKRWQTNSKKGWFGKQSALNFEKSTARNDFIDDFDRQLGDAFNAANSEPRSFEDAREVQEFLDREFAIQRQRQEVAVEPIRRRKNKGKKGK